MTDMKRVRVIKDGGNGQNISKARLVTTSPIDPRQGDTTKASEPAGGEPRTGVEDPSPKALGPVHFDSSRIGKREIEERYSRQSLFKGWNQKDLMKSRALIIGAGGFGTVALMLGRSGIGHLIICDADKVSLSNLNRQEFRKEDIGKNKAIALGEKIHQEIGTCSVDCYPVDFQELIAECPDLSSSIDIVLVLVDNDISRFDAARYCRENKLPAIFASVSKDGVGGIVFFQDAVAPPCWACAMKIGRKNPSNERNVCGASPSAVYLHHVFGGQTVYIALLYLMGMKIPWRMRWEWINEEARVSNPPMDTECPICNKR